jgi:hypothetical protein
MKCVACTRYTESGYAEFVVRIRANREMECVVIRTDVLGNGILCGRYVHQRRKKNDSELNRKWKWNLWPGQCGGMCVERRHRKCGFGLAETATSPSESFPILESFYKT